MQGKKPRGHRDHRGHRHHQRTLEVISTERAEFTDSAHIASVPFATAGVAPSDGRNELPKSLVGPFVHYWKWWPLFKWEGGDFHLDVDHPHERLGRRFASLEG